MKGAGMLRASSAWSTGHSTPALQASGTVALPLRSAWLFGWFRGYARRYLARRFHAARLAREGFRPGAEELDGPIIVVLNHPSWWDPLFGLVLSSLFPGRLHAAPIDSSALARYRFFERLGFFGIERGTARGARQFLRRAETALRSGSVLWITAQGRFTDAHERPVRLAPGIGHLACRLDTGWLLPLALEYGFWDESTPEAFARFGSPIAVEGPARDTQPATSAAWTARVAAALEQTQDALAADVRRRDPARFETLVAGRAGIGGVYDAWRQIRAALRGERFVASHGSVGSARSPRCAAP